MTELWTGARRAPTLSRSGTGGERALKYAPDTILDISRDPEPARVLPKAPELLLFDLAADPYKRVDLVTQRPEVVARLLGMLEGWFEEVDAERRRVER